MTHMTGLTAVDPLGRSSTVPTEPSASVVVTSFAPPVRVQPVPSKLPALSPGINVYQLESFAEANGCDNAPVVHPDVSTGDVTRRSLGAPCGQRRDADAEPDGPAKYCGISSQHIPSVVVLAAEPSRDPARPLALRPRLAPGLPFSADLTGG